MNTFKFGTDGIRGVVNRDLTIDKAYQLGCSLALFLLEEIDKPVVVIGEDTRNSCAMLKSAVISGLLSYGVTCINLGVVTTPALAFITKIKKANAGVMITASHNSFEYNGFKIFDKKGCKIDIKTSLVLERYAMILNNFKPKDAGDIGKLLENKKAINKYVNHLKRKIRNNKYKVCFDCSNGTTNYIISKLFGNDLIVLGNSIDGNLVNNNCGATKIEVLRNKMMTSNFDVGFAFDGDGDRIIAVSKSGKVIDGDEILYILAKYLKDKNKLRHSTVVGTIVTNYGVEKSLNRIGVELVRQQVGDKFIHLEMKKKGYVLGGEQSGHIILGGETTTGDGVLTAISILNIMNELDCDLDVLCKDIIKFSQYSINVPIKFENKDYIIQNYEFNEYLKRLEDELSYTGRILVRPSGTENLIRILIEGENMQVCEKCAKSIENKIIALNIWYLFAIFDWIC